MLFLKKVLDKAEKDLYGILPSGDSGLNPGGSFERSSIIVECLQNQDSCNRLTGMSAWADLLEGEDERPQTHIK